MNIIRQRLIIAEADEDIVQNIVDELAKTERTHITDLLQNIFTYKDFQQMTFPNYGGDMEIIKEFMSQKSALKKELYEDYFNTLITAAELLRNKQQSFDFIKNKAQNVEQIDVHDLDSIINGLSSALKSFMTELTESSNEVNDILSRMEKEYKKQQKSNTDKAEAKQKTIGGLKSIKGLLKEYGAEINDNLYNLYSDAMVGLYQAKYPKASDSQLEKYYNNSNQELDGFLNDIFNEDIAPKSLAKLLSSVDVKNISEDSSASDVQSVFRKALDPIIKEWLHKLKRNIKQDYPLPQV